MSYKNQIAIIIISIFAVACLFYSWSQQVEAQEDTVNELSGTAEQLPTTNAYYLVTCFLLALSFWGYGVVLHRWAKLDKQFQGLAFCSGAAFLIFIGSLLNMFKLISVPLNFVIIVSGVILAIYYIVKHVDISNFETILQANRVYTIVALCIFAIGIIYSIEIIGTYNWIDDFHGYINHPKQMLAVGYFQEDPFNTRRSLTLGGQAYLHVLYLSLGNNLRSVKLLDTFLFRTIAAFSVFWLCLRSSGVNKVIALLSFVFIEVFFPGEQANITTYYSTILFCFALLVLLMQPIPFSGKRGILLALILASLFSLKLQNFGMILPAILIYCLHFLIDNNRKKLLRDGAVFAVLIILFLAPWLFDMYRATGSFLVPFLGKGIFGPYDTMSVISVVPSSLTRTDIPKILKMMCLTPRYYPFILLAVVPSLYALLKKEIRPLLIVIAVTFVSFAILHTCDMGYDIMRERFSNVFIWSLIVYSVYSCFTHHTAIFPSLFRSLMIGGFLSLNIFFLDTTYQNISEEPAVYGFTFFKPVENTNILPASQSIVPPSAKILLYHSYPYLFNMKRNRIFIADSAGLIGPTGGFVANDSQKIIEFLRSVDIEYIIYSYSNAANYSRQSFGYRLKRSKKAGTYANLTRIMAKNNIEFGETLSSLIGSDHVIYQDERDIVIQCNSQ